MEVYERKSLRPFTQPEELKQITKLLGDIQSKLSQRHLKRQNTGHTNLQDKLDEASKELAVYEIDLESVSKLAKNLLEMYTTITTRFNSLSEDYDQVSHQKQQLEKEHKGLKFKVEQTEAELQVQTQVNEEIKYLNVLAQKAVEEVENSSQSKPVQEFRQSIDLQYRKSSLSINESGELKKMNIRLQRENKIFEERLIQVESNLVKSEQMYDDILVKNQTLEGLVSKLQNEKKSSHDDLKDNKTKIKDLEMDLKTERNLKKLLERDLEIYKKNPKTIEKKKTFAPTISLQDELAAIETDNVVEKKPQRPPGWKRPLAMDIPEISDDFFQGPMTVPAKAANICITPRNVAGWNFKDLAEVKEKEEERLQMSPNVVIFQQSPSKNNQEEEITMVTTEASNESPVEKNKPSFLSSDKPMSDFMLTSESEKSESPARNVNVENIEDRGNSDSEPKQMCSIGVETDPIDLNVMVPAEATIEASSIPTPAQLADQSLEMSPIVPNKASNLTTTNQNVQGWESNQQKPEKETGNSLSMSSNAVMFQQMPQEKIPDYKPVILSEEPVIVVKKPPLAQTQPSGENTKPPLFMNDVSRISNAKRGSDFSLTSFSEVDLSQIIHLNVEYIGNIVNFDPEPKQMCSIGVGSESINPMPVVVCNAEAIEEKSFPDIQLVQSEDVSLSDNSPTSSRAPSITPSTKKPKFFTFMNDTGTEVDDEFKHQDLGMKETSFVGFMPKESAASQPAVSHSRSTSAFSDLTIPHYDLKPIIYQFQVEEPGPHTEVIDATVNEEYFKLTCLAVKLNCAFMENVCHISANELYAEALQRKIPFQKYYVWIDAKLTNAYTEVFFKK